MKNKFILLMAAVLSLSLLSCKSQLSVQAGNDDSAKVEFSIGFSKKAASMLKELMGAVSQDSNADNSIITGQDVANLLRSVGTTDVKASAKADQVSANGTLKELSKTKISSSKILSKTANSLTVSIGTEQINSIYESMDEESKSYFDLLMVPALTGEEMNVKEYNELLASVYGPELADEVTEGTLQIELKSPDGKKSVKDSITLGRLLTGTTTKSWSVKW